MIKNIFYYIIFLITIFCNVAFAEGDPFTKRLTRDSLSNSMDSGTKEPAIFKNKNNSEFSSSVANESLEKYILKATALAPKGKDANSSNKNDQNSKINSNNMAIVTIGNKEIMVRQGDKLGNKNGVIISIEKNSMTVVEDGKEFIFEINTPLNLKRTNNVR
jgi:Tfp pilus assembly protein PilP